MTDETEACMSGWEVPQEIDRLARIASPAAFDAVERDQNGPIASEIAQKIARQRVERILTDLAENPPQCAVEVMRNCGTLNMELPRQVCREMFVDAINAIREAK